MASNLIPMTSNLLVTSDEQWPPTSNLLAMSNGLQPNTDDLQATSDEQWPPT